MHKYPFIVETTSIRQSLDKKKERWPRATNSPNLTIRHSLANVNFPVCFPPYFFFFFSLLIQEIGQVDFGHPRNVGYYTIQDTIVLWKRRPSIIPVDGKSKKLESSWNFRQFSSFFLSGRSPLDRSLQSNFILF